MADTAPIASPSRTLPRLTFRSRLVRTSLGHCGSFVDIRDGDRMAQRVRREAARPLRVFLQTGEHDLDIVFGNWTLANRELAAALAYRGMAHRLVVGEGGHSLRHGGALLAEALRWLWQE